MHLKHYPYIDAISLDVCGKPISPIIMASLAGLPNNVRKLLDDGAEVDGDVGNLNDNDKAEFGTIYELPKNIITRPIHAAAISGNLEILRLLVEKGATLNQSELNMVARKVTRQAVDVLNYIVEEQPSLKITDDTVIASAMNQSSKEMLSYILEHENRLTQSQLVAIAKNYKSAGGGHDVIERIISYGERIECDRNEILMAFLRWSNCGPHIGDVLHRYRPPNSMTNSVLQSVLGNHRGARSMLKFVIRYYRDVDMDIHISLDMLEEVRKSDDSSELFTIILENAKTVVVGTDTLQAFNQHSHGVNLMSLLMKHGLRGYRYTLRPYSQVGAVRIFEKHLSSSPVTITSETLQLAAQLDENALETIRKDARPNVTLPSVDEIRDLVEKRSSGTQQQTESTLARMPSPEPATAPQSKGS